MLHNTMIVLFFSISEILDFFDPWLISWFKKSQKESIFSLLEKEEDEIKAEMAPLLEDNSSSEVHCGAFASVPFDW